MRTWFHNKLVAACVFILLICNHAVFSQVEIEVELLLSPTLQNAKIVYISNFDLLREGAAQFLYQVTITNNSGQEQRGKLSFKVKRDDEDVISAMTREFRLPSQPSIISLNNIQLTMGYPLPNGDQIIYDEQNIQNPSNEFQDEVLQGGKLPDGRYILLTSFINTITNEEFPSPITTLEVMSSPYIFPIAPGSNDISNPEIIYSQFPVFQFNTNLSDPLALLDEPFLVQVYKKLDFHNSADEVLTTTPHLEYRTGRTIFQYPQGEGEQPLEPGSYLWRVQMILPTTHGTEIIQSPILAFNFMDPTNAGESMIEKATAEEVFRLLRYLLGQQADVYAQMLNGYSLKTIRINGETIKLTELFSRIMRYEGKVFRIEDLELFSSQY